MEERRGQGVQVALAELIEQRRHLEVDAILMAVPSTYSITRNAASAPFQGARNAA
jgi:hypothetical protein